MTDCPFRHVTVGIAIPPILGLAFLLVSVSPVFGTQNLRVGVLQDPPIASMTRSGRFEGFTVDILQSIARERDWKMSYETGTEAELLDRLERKQIDLLANLAYSQEYEDRYRFTQQYLINNWGEIVVRDNSSIDSLADLDGKRIGVVRSSHHYTALQDLLSRFGIESELIDYPSFDDVTDAIVGSEIDAGALSRVFMLRRAAQYNIRRAAVTFAPLEIRYAATNPAPAGVLEAIDDFIKEGKKSGSTYFYKVFDKWFPLDRSYSLPRYVVWSLYVVAAFTTGVFLGRGLQRKQMRKSVRELIEEDKKLNKESSA